MISLAVSPGDQVTVSISQVSAGSWKIAVTNVTTGHSFSTTQSYTGPATSAEWIVEDPTLASTGQIETLGRYTPNVTFRGLAASGPVTAVVAVAMLQSGGQVSTPSDPEPRRLHRRLRRLGAGRAHLVTRPQEPGAGTRTL